MSLENEELGDSLDIDVVGFVDLDLKPIGLDAQFSRNDQEGLFDFDSSNDYGLFDEGGVGSFSTTPPSAIMNPPSTVGKSGRGRKAPWTEMEIDLFQKGLEMFGPNWHKISRFVATKNAVQVQRFHAKWAETANVINDGIDDSSFLLDDAGFAPLYLDPNTCSPLCSSPMGQTRGEGASCNRSWDSVVVGTEVELGILVGEFAEEWIIDTDCQTRINDANSMCLVSDYLEGQTETTQFNECEASLPKDFLLTSPPHRARRRDSSESHQHKKQQRSVDHLKGHCQSKVTQPLLEGQIVRITREETEEVDVDIDISDNEDNPSLNCVQKTNTDSVASLLSNISAVDSTVNVTRKKNEGTGDEKVILQVEEDDMLEVCNEEGEEEVPPTTSIPESEDEGMRKVFHFPPPLAECHLDPAVIMDDERRIHFNYFNGRGVNTPERYMRIRNYLLNYWNETRPRFMRKTNVRRGLRECGDVNSIGKVHDYLEKIGAINFGCPEADYQSALVIGARTRPRPTVVPPVPIPEKMGRKVDRSQLKRKKFHGGGIGLVGNGTLTGGGLTISHDETGGVIDACHVSEGARRKGDAVGGRYRRAITGHESQFKLVRCLEYDPDTPPPFRVTVHAHALVVLDLHSHTSTGEVMGLLGGYMDPLTQCLHVTVAVPTKAKSSGVECDMCPISQSAACNAINGGGVQVVGWYHSHPTFPPNPSVQDVSTQAGMHAWFARVDAPFLGVIVSPFCPINENEAAEIRCIVLDRPPHASRGDFADPIPYKLQWETSGSVPGGWDELRVSVRSLVRAGRTDPLAVEWRGEWRGGVTHWEKALASLNHHLPHLPGLCGTVKQTFLQAVKENLDLA